MLLCYQSLCSICVQAPVSLRWFAFPQYWSLQPLTYCSSVSDGICYRALSVLKGIHFVSNVSDKTTKWWLHDGGGRRGADYSELSTLKLSEETTWLWKKGLAQSPDAVFHWTLFIHIAGYTEQALCVTSHALKTRVVNSFCTHKMELIIGSGLKFQ